MKYLSQHNQTQKATTYLCTLNQLFQQKMSAVVLIGFNKTKFPAVPLCYLAFQIFNSMNKIQIYCQISI